MRAIAIIPARYGSTRFPGKPLVPIAGVPLIVRVMERVGQAAFDEVIVATDDERIKAVVDAAGGTSVMTGAHASGTDRVAEAAKNLDASVIVNVQGDEPLVDPRDLDVLIAAVPRYPNALHTLARPLSHAPHAVTLAREESGLALDFYRERPDQPAASLWEHVGVYGYSPSALQQFCQWAPTDRETKLRLEQLRALDHGMKVWAHRCVGAGPQPAVDYPEDVARVEAFLATER